MTDDEHSPTRTATDRELRSTDRESDGAPLLLSFDRETDSVTQTIVTAVAGLEDTAPTALDPLYSVVDPETLDGLINSTARRSSPADVEVRIGYHGYTVTVHSYGVVEISPKDDA